MGLVRTLYVSDWSEVLSLNLSARPGVSALDHEEFSRLMSLSGEHLIALDDDKVIGYALIFSDADEYDGEEFLQLKSSLKQPFLYIDQVAVRTSDRGKGVGRLLYNAIERSALQRGVKSLCCEVNVIPPNPESLAFHHRLGFVSVSDLATLDGRQVSLLCKKLAVLDA